MRRRRGQRDPAMVATVATVAAVLTVLCCGVAVVTEGAAIRAGPAAEQMVSGRAVFVAGSLLCAGCFCTESLAECAGKRLRVPRGTAGHCHGMCSTKGRRAEESCLSPRLIISISHFARPG